MEITIMLILGFILAALGAYNLQAKSNIFGIILGLALIVFGLFAFFDGIEYKTGFTAQPQGTFGVNESLNVTYNYVDLADDREGLHRTITFGMMLMGIYVMFNSGFNLAGIRQKT